SLILFSLLIIIFVSNFRIYKIISIFFSIIIIFCVTSFNPNAKTRIVDLTFSQVKQTQIPLLPYSDHHEEHYISALKMFNKNPIFGIGTNLFRFQCNKPEYKYKKRSCNSHPHNFYFQTLAELGFIGFAFLIFFFSYLFSICVRKITSIKQFNKIKELPFDYFLYPIILITYWWPVIPHMSLYNNWNNALVMLPLGFFMKYFYGNKKWNSL
ncbi:O-antigen ligase family protein, partial [Alphaproteobacteria bacterium]|nr:O-antigen ligase family protein [Alphaproteobacteria bacterium]